MTVSASSWAITLTAESTAALPLGEVPWEKQPPQPEVGGTPTEIYL